MAKKQVLIGTERRSVSSWTLDKSLGPQAPSTSGELITETVLEVALGHLAAPAFGTR